MRLTRDQVAAWRLRRHRLSERVARPALLEVIAHLCGVHAQLLSSAELALWARAQGLERGQVEHALWEERALVKTWAMRGTLHLLPAAEFPLWRAALGTYAHYLKPGWLRAFGVKREELERLLAAVSGALDGRILTREELAAEVDRRTGSAALADKVRESWGAMLKPAAFRGHLCVAPNEGQNVRFTHPESWLGPTPAVDSQVALLEITRRFLSAYGPVTREHFARWWATTPAQAGGLLARLATTWSRWRSRGRGAGCGVQTPPKRRRSPRRAR